MTWGRVDENAPHHPKVHRVGLEGFGFHVAAVCFSNRFLTDGRIRPDELTLIFPGVTKAAAVKLARRLVDAELWEENGAAWRIHDFLDYNPSAAEVRQDREAARARQQARRQRLRGTDLSHNGSHSDSHADSHTVTDGEVTPGVRVPRSEPSRSDPIRPDPNRSEEVHPPKPPKGGSLPPGFERFWLAYPKRVAKDKALAAWRKRGCEPITDEVLAGLEQTRAWIQRQDGEFTKNPATWLNDGGWKDDPPDLATRNGAGATRRRINELWKGKTEGGEVTL